jgi:hypothetical protein
MAGLTGIVQTNDASRAPYLQRLDAIQSALIDAARERPHAAGHAWNHIGQHRTRPVRTARRDVRRARRHRVCAGRASNLILRPSAPDPIRSDR